MRKNCRTRAVIEGTSRYAAVGSVAAVFALTGCGGSDDSTDTDDPQGNVETPLLEPPEAGRGIQVKMATSIEAGQEVEHCQFVRSGSEPLIVNHDEVRFSSGSHHVLLYTTGYDEIPTENDYGEPVDTSEIFDCSEGVQGFWSATGLIAASQSAEGESAISFPEGVGVRVPADTILLVNAHYINPTASTLEPQIYINLHSIPEDELEQEGGLLFWYNPFLKVPANGTSVMRASCEIEDDIRITNGQSHMHKRGVGYVAEVVSPDGERETVYTGNAWEDVPVKHYSPNLEVSAGSRLEWECEYENTEGRDVFQGPRTTDEMCMFLGSYYPRNDRIGFCMRNGRPFLGSQWMMGTGEASCADSLSCILEANSGAGEAATGTRNQDRTTKITECLLASEPSVSAPLSDVLGCLATAPEGQQLAECAEQVEACQSL